MCHKRSSVRPGRMKTVKRDNENEKKKAFSWFCSKETGNHCRRLPCLHSVKVIFGLWGWKLLTLGSCVAASFCRCDCSRGSRTVVSYRTQDKRLLSLIRSQTTTSSSSDHCLGIDFEQVCGWVSHGVWDWRGLTAETEQRRHPWTWIGGHTSCPVQL